MKKSLGLPVLLVLVLAAGCACPTAAPPPGPAPGPEPPPAVSPEYAEKLASRFCPILKLKGDGEATENFGPQQIEIMVDEALLRSTGNPSFSEEATLPGLVQWSKSDYYIDLEGLGVATHSPEEYKLSYDRVEGQYKPTVYARVSEGTGGSPTILQYWLFYYFNDWRNLHEGDWELVQLSFPGATARELLESGEPPVFAAYSQHQAGQWMSWGDMKRNSLVEGTHPVVYVARGSHANYFTPGSFWSGLDFDDTGLSSWQVIRPEQLDVVLLPGAGEPELPWLGFKGYWGEYLGFSVSVGDMTFWQHGPHGPLWSGEAQPGKRWASPEEWAGGLSEYPQPFWLSFFKPLGDWAKLAVFSLFSPADLHVYDALGRHVGINELGELETQIPGAFYITPEGTDYKTILLPDADVSQEYTILVRGTGSGLMDIKAQLPDEKTGTKRFLEYLSVPVSATTVARVVVPPEVPRVGISEVPSETARDITTKLELDSDGDGIFEMEGVPGNFARQSVVRPPLRAEVDIKPDTLVLSGATAEELVVAYIELPAGYSPKRIDVATVRLAGIPAQEKPIDVADHDQDGLYELVVEFDRHLVIGYLEENNLLKGEVTLTLTGAVDGWAFEGADSLYVVVREVGGQ